MGSLAAVFSKSGALEPDVVGRMLAAAPHRGACVEVHRRGDAVVGISNAADFVDTTISADTRLLGAFSGQLDNHMELSRTLAGAGFPPASTRPADVVVAAFRAHGQDAPRHFRGVFAGMVTDGIQLWMFRDQVGFQPLFYSERADALFAATEVKQVLAGAELAREPDTDVLERIFYGRLRSDSGSAFKHVRRLPHATTLTVTREGAQSPRTYWQPRRFLEIAKFKSYEEVKERFDALFDQAVERCLTGADVVSLSGGVDSPVVAGFAAPLYSRRTGKPLPALSLVFPAEPRVDERPYIELVADFLGMSLHTYTPKAKALDDLVTWCRALDAPIPNINAPQMTEYYNQARQLGYRNVLTGDIAECLIDLQRHVAGHLLIKGRWTALARLLAAQRKQSAGLRRLSTWRNFASQLVMPFVPGRVANWYLAARARDFPERVPDWLDARKVNEVPFRNDLVPPGRDRWSALQVMPLEGCPITMEGVEVCAAISGVTVRRPFADIDLWEFFLSIPAEIKYPDLRSKTLLRRLARGRVPDAIVDRRDKTYFDDHAMAQIDYDILRRFLVNTEYRVAGVDYNRLAARLSQQDLTLIDWIWMNDLVRIHAFVSQC